jgi:hypothetical protein
LMIDQDMKWRWHWPWNRIASSIMPAKLLYLSELEFNDISGSPVVCSHFVPSSRSRVMTTLQSCTLRLLVPAGKTHWGRQVVLQTAFHIFPGR